MAEIHFGATLTPTKVELVEEWIGTQRWYAGKGSRPALRRLAAWRLDDPAGEVGVETLVLADESGPTPVVYQVPLSYRGAPLEGAQDALVGTMQHSVLGTRWVYDATHDPVYATQLLELVQGRVRAASSAANDAVEETVTGVPQASWRHPARVRSARVLAGEQSNTSIILDAVLEDGRELPLIVKVFRMLAPGDNPDVVLQGALRDAGSRRVPAVVGSVTGQWPHPTAAGDVPAHGHLAFAQEFLAGVEDAWRVALRSAADGEDFTGPARDLGRVTAEVHVALAESLGTRPTDPEAVDLALAAMRGRLADALLVVPQLAEVAERVEALYDAARHEPWPPLQRIHGDYHLGQVLHSPQGGWVLLDFEGEPLRPLAERARPDLWPRDVAGMLRSIDYVGGAVEHSGHASARTWVRDVQQAFLTGYADAGTDPARYAAVLAAYELDKAMYEVVYEARNRPDWLDLPLAAIRRLTDTIPAGPSEGDPQ